MSWSVFSLSDILPPEEIKNIQYLDLSVENVLKLLREHDKVEGAEYLGNGFFYVIPKKTTGEEPFRFRIYLEEN